MSSNKPHVGLSEHDAAYCAAAWASGQTQRSLAAHFGYRESRPSAVNRAIGKFLDKYSGRRVTWDDQAPVICYNDERKALVPEALARFRATLA